MNLNEMYKRGELVIGNKYTSVLNGQTKILQFVGYAKGLNQPFLFMDDRLTIMYFSGCCFGFTKHYELITKKLIAHIWNVPFRGVVIRAYEEQEQASAELTHYIIAPDSIQNLDIAFINDCNVPEKRIEL